MPLARPLVLAASALALLVAACSTPADVGVPTLEPQFGSPRDDYANVVTTDAARGRVYVAGAYTGPYDENGLTARGDVVFFRRHDRDGSLAWKVSANVEAPGGFATPTAADTDRAGNVYFGWSTSAATLDPEVRANRAFISKYTPTGKLLFRKELPNETLRGLATGASGDLYATFARYGPPSTSFYLRKYSSSGRLIWAKELRVPDEDFIDDLGGVAGLDVAPDGSVFVAAEYGSSGGLLLKLRGGDGQLLGVSSVGGDFALDVEVGGGAVYVYSALDAPFHFEPIVSSFRPDGLRVWERRGFFESDETFGNLRYDAAAGGISADAQGNVYLAGAFVVEGSGGGADGYDTNVLVRKYTSSGGVAYDRRLIDPATEASGRGVAAASSGELYLVGSTDGRVNGKGRGGREALLLRLDGQGRKVWER